MSSAVPKGLFIGEGSSDLPLRDHVERIAAAHGVPLRVSAPDLSRLPEPPGRDVGSMAVAALALAGPSSLLFVHRDADRETADVRRAQIHESLRAAALELPAVAVIPVRMTESWLLVDEGAIRAVAGNPAGREPLDLPVAHRAEAVADPKALLREALKRASGLRQRRLRDFTNDFGHHRRQLLERLDPEGPVAQLGSWRQFVADVEEAVAKL